MAEVRVMRGVIGTQSTPNLWVRLKEQQQSVELFVMHANNSYAAHLTPDEARSLAEQLYELAHRIEAPIPIKRDQRGRFAA